VGPRSDALRAAIDEAWRVFDIPAPQDLGVCTGCCMDPALAAEMQATPARELSERHVLEWYGAAFTSDPTFGQVTWFLPRVLEMLADGKEVAHVGEEVAFARLPLTGFPGRWPERQVAAINCFALAHLDMKLVADPPLDWGELDRMLCMFGQGGIDMGPLLARLDALPDRDLAAILHQSWYYFKSGSIPVNAFWSRQPAKSQVWGWYTSKALMERMARAAMDGDELALEIHALIATVRANDGL
jgi:hypothetical protein